MTDRQRLSGKVAIVTGAASGIGRAIAERFHGAGASVVVADQSGEETASAQSLGGRALTVPADRYSSFLLFAKRAAAKYGVQARELLLELGRRRIVGGQENMIEDAALTLANQRGHA
jgi:NAD(P)-dependent dehydrogenase (short-subunit alcohol dehydrogenase family)